MEKNTTTPTEKSKKKVSFGRTKVRLVFDYPNENFTQDEDTDERTSQELTRMKEIQTQLQKQPKKPILKSTVRSGPNTLKGRTKHMLEWDKMDRNFWVPAKQTRRGRRRDSSPSEGDAGLSFAKREESLHNVKENSSASNKTTMSNKDEKTVDKDEDSSVGAVLSKKATNIDEKLEVKNNQKWRGVVGDHKYELNKFVGVYKGVEADLEQTRQSLLKIGVDVSEDELQNPRDFVTIMNMLLCVQQDESDKQTSAKSQRDLAEQHPAFPQDLDTISTRKEVSDEPPNSHGSFEVEQKSIPNSRVSGSNVEDLIIKEELINDELNSTHNEKLQNRKSSKRFRMKGFLPTKKGKTDGKMTRGDKKDSEDYLSFSPSIGSEKNMDSKECSSSDKFRSLKDRSSLNASHSQRPQRSQSEDNLDHFGKTKKQKTRKTNDSKSMDDINSDMECSTDSSLYRERAFSDNNLNLPRRVSVDHDLTQDVLYPSARDRGSSVIEAKFQESKNLDRPKIVKRDSWFLTKKQKLRGEYQEGSEERSNPKEECSTDSSLFRERAFSDNNLNLPRRVSVDHNSMQDVLYPSARDRGSSVIEAKFQESKNRERPKNVKRDSWFLTKKQKMRGEYQEGSEERSNPKEKLKNSWKRRVETTEDKSTDECSSSVSESDGRNERSNSKKDLEKPDIPTLKIRPTLLMISNQSGSEKEDLETTTPSDSGLSTSSVNDNNNKGYQYDSELSNYNQVGAMNNQERKEIIISRDVNNNENTKMNCEMSKQNKSTECSRDASEENLDLKEETKLPGARESREDCQVDEETRAQKTSPTTAGNEQRHDEVDSLFQIIEKDTERNKQETNDCINENNIFIKVDDKCLREFLNDIHSIDRETRRSLISEEYRDRARKRYRPKEREKTLTLKIITAIHKNTAPEICLMYAWF